MSAMVTYRYVAVSMAGKKLRGEMEAPNRHSVIEHLHNLGYMPLAADPKAEGWINWLRQKDFFGTNKILLRDVAFITQELATMLQAGLSLEKALTMLAKVASKSQVVTLLDNVVARVRSGAGLASALSSQGLVLPKAYIGMIRAGEAGGGKMQEVTLQRVAEYLSRTQAIKDSVASAILYPAILLVMAALSIMIMLVYVLPQFEPIFQSAVETLPFSTRAVLSVGHALRDYGMFIFALLVILAFQARRCLQRENIAMRVDALLLRVPQLGQTIAKLETAKFCRTLGMLQSNGVPLASALPIASDCFANRVFVQMAQRIVKRVREGEALSSLLQVSNLFPPLAMQMIRIGEETGNLDDLLLKVADIYEQDVKKSVEKMMTLLAPALTVILGVIIAVLIASVLSAILSVNDRVI